MHKFLCKNPSCPLFPSGSKPEGLNSRASSSGGDMLSGFLGGLFEDSLRVKQQFFVSKKGVGSVPKFVARARVAASGGML